MAYSLLTSGFLFLVKVKKQKRDEVCNMNGFLSTVGSCAIVVLVAYIIKKINDYLYSKKENNQNYKFDKEDDND
jgi:hypothetical protein